MCLYLLIAEIGCIALSGVLVFRDSSEWVVPLCILSIIFLATIDLSSEEELRRFLRGGRVVVFIVAVAFGSWLSLEQSRFFKEAWKKAEMEEVLSVKTEVDKDTESVYVVFGTPTKKDIRVGITKNTESLLDLKVGDEIRFAQSRELTKFEIKAN